MTTVRVMHGSGNGPYGIFARHTFHTRFAAELFGWLTCAQDPRTLYWVIDAQPVAT